MTDRLLFKQALEALEKCMYPQLKQLNAITALRTAIAEAEKQEPVAWMFTDVEGTEFFEEREDWEGKWTPLYTTPPAAQRQWVGLTQEDIAEIVEKLGLADVAWIDLMQAIERRLKKRNA
jgi:hypothetical protein